MNTHGSFKIGRGHTRPHRSWSGRSVVSIKPKRTIRQMSVDPNMLIRKATPTSPTEYIPSNHFSNFGLFAQLSENVAKKGYINPTPIQDQIIPQIMAGHDVIGLAATGTGKTAAFLLPIIHKLNAFPKEKAIIITPTRELALQIMEEGRSFANNTQCRFTLIIGGTDMKRQIQELRRQPQIVVGTPGRINDLTNQREISLHEYTTIVLDEVDRMLDMGFIGDIRKIIQALPTKRHSLFFSATMSEKVKSVAKSFLTKPITIQIASQKASDNVDQDIIKLGGRNKAQVLRDLLKQPGFDKVLVFGRTKHGMEKLSRYLYDLGFSTASIHGNKSQNQRQRALTAFKNNKIQVLLATDVAARGIDVDNITHVINYELPETYEDYIHRIGRTGRAHKTGIALTFVD